MILLVVVGAWGDVVGNAVVHLMVREDEPLRTFLQKPSVAS